MASTNRFLPDFIPTAPPENVGLVNGCARPAIDNVPFEVVDPFDLASAQHAWVGVQTFSPARSSTPTFELSDPVGSWQELEAAAMGVVLKHIASADFRGYAQERNRGTPLGQPRENPRQTANKAKNTGWDGLVTGRAFLQVIPEVEAPKQFESPNEEIAGIAMRSIGFISEFARVHREMDHPLVSALSSPPGAKAKNQSDNTLFRNLRFHQGWFVDENRTVMVDRKKAPELRDYKGRRLIDLELDSRQLFGCAYLRYVIPLSKMMIHRAAKDNLFGQSYEAARAKA